MMSTVSIFVVFQCFMLAPSDVLGYYTASSYYNGMEYAHFSGGQDNTHFLNAIVSCTMWRRGSELAQPKTDGINNAVVEATAPQYEPSWVGATDVYGEDYWRWLDGDLITWANWRTGEPNNGGDEDCGLINHPLGSEGMWDDNDCCAQSIGFICEFATVRIQPLDNSNLTFHEIASPITFLEARASCHNLGARLVKIENDRAKKILAQNIKRTGKKYWVDDEEDGCHLLYKENSEEVSSDEPPYGYICETVRPHNVQVSDETPIVNETENLEIECSASGYPLPRVAWYKDDQLVENQFIGEASAILKITNAKESDGGLYICRAYNGSTKSSGLSRVTLARKND